MEDGETRKTEPHWEAQSSSSKEDDVIFGVFPIAANRWLYFLSAVDPLLHSPLASVIFWYLCNAALPNPAHFPSSVYCLFRSGWLTPFHSSCRFLFSCYPSCSVPPTGSYLTSADLTFIATANLKPESLQGKQDFALMFSVKHQGGHLSKIRSTLSLTP